MSRTFLGILAKFGNLVKIVADILRICHDLRLGEKLSRTFGEFVICENLVMNVADIVGILAKFGN